MRPVARPELLQRTFALPGSRATAAAQVGPGLCRKRWSIDQPQPNANRSASDIYVFSARGLIVWCFRRRRSGLDRPRSAHQPFAAIKAIESGRRLGHQESGSGRSGRGLLNGAP